MALTGKYADPKYRPDFSKLKEMKPISKEEIQKIIAECSKEDSNDEFITNILTGKTHLLSWDSEESFYDYIERIHYFERHPYMKKYCIFNYTIMEIIKIMNTMSQTGCYDISEFVDDQSGFREYMDYVITDVLKGNICANDFIPGCPIKAIAEGIGFYERHKDLKSC